MKIEFLIALVFCMATELVSCVLFRFQYHKKKKSRKRRTKIETYPLNRVVQGFQDSCTSYCGADSRGRIALFPTIKLALIIKLEGEFETELSWLSQTNLSHPMHSLRQCQPTRSTGVLARRGNTRVFAKPMTENIIDNF